MEVYIMLECVTHIQLESHVIIPALPVCCYTCSFLLSSLLCFHSCLYGCYIRSVTVLILTIYDIRFTCGIKRAHSSRVLYNNSKPTCAEKTSTYECLVRHAILIAL